MRSDAIASGVSFRRTSRNNSPTAAMTRPISPAVSSTTIARTSGSLERIRCRHTLRPRSRASLRA